MLIFYLNMINTPEEKEKVEQLYYKYRKLMKFIALKMLKNEEKAEDAVSDALISLIENLDKIGDVDNKKTKAFVYTVIRCIALNHFNKDTRHTSIYLSEDIIHNKIEDTDVFEDIYLNDWFLFIHQLPEIYRDVMLLKVYYEMKNPEIAKIMHLKESTVRKRIERARVLLKETAKRGDLIDV